MRDRLIELLKEYGKDPKKTCPNWGSNEPCEGCKYDLGETCDYDGRIADHLLANGVIVPPVSIVGQTVYIPWIYGGTKGVAFFEVTHIITDNRKSYIRTNFDTDDEGFWEEFNGGQFDFEDFGKTVFLTREEAEKALAEREGKG